MRIHLAPLLAVLILETPGSFACSPHVSNSTQNGNTTLAHELLMDSIGAMGGMDTLSKVTGLTMSDRNIFRTQTLTQSYKLQNSDEFLATRGAQNISYNYALGATRQVIERDYTLSDYWIWSLPNLQPDVTFSLLVQDGNDSLAWFRKGSNCLLNGPQSALGYADSGLTKYLIGEAQRNDPLLLYHMLQKGTIQYKEEMVNGIGMPGVYDRTLDLSVVFSSSTQLPWIIRRRIYNRVFGHSTSDVYLTDYRPVNGSDGLSLKLPHRRQTVFNDLSVLEDSVFEDFDINPKFRNGTFSVQVDPKSAHTSPYDPHLQANFSVSDIGEFYEAALWSGEMSQNLDQVNATHPIEGLAQLWQLEFSDGKGSQSGYRQMVVELEDGVLVTDATAHLSTPVLKWVQETIRKPVKYIWLSHHHHDHAYAVTEYVKAGAAVVIPEVARDYWSQLGEATFVTYTDSHPFVVSDKNIQARGIWRPSAPHAEDWAWLAVTKNCPGEDDSVAIFEADVWNPDGQGARFDLGFARQWLQWLDEDGVKNDTVVVAAHGLVQQLSGLIEITGYPFPDNRLLDFVPGGKWYCRM